MDIFDEFLSANNLRKVQVANYLGVSKQAISSITGGTLKPSPALLQRIKENPEWDTSMIPDTLPQKKSTSSVGKAKSIKIVPQSAVAGYLLENNGVDVVRADEFISFVDFVERSADFAIRVDGDSMYPRYNNGEVLACRILQDRNLFDYGRVYVLNTRNGCVVKKVLPSGGDPDKVLCHSENPLYPDYEISKSDILGVAVVVGHAGVE
jgi:phage repressor protein C with HTH and peptisase S24 domain